MYFPKTEHGGSHGGCHGGKVFRFSSFEPLVFNFGGFKRGSAGKVFKFWANERGTALFGGRPFGGKKFSSFQLFRLSPQIEPQAQP